MTSPSGNPLSPRPRFVPVDARALAENAQAMIKLTDKHKRDAKEMSGQNKSQDDDWQSVTK